MSAGEARSAARRYPRLGAWTWRTGLTIRVYRVGFYVGLLSPFQRNRPAFNRYEIGCGLVGFFRWGPA